MREGQKRVNVYIPDDLYSRVLTSEYNVTEAIILGLEKLLEPVTEDIDSTIDVSTNNNLDTSQETLEEYKTQVRALNDEITRLRSVLMEAPDPIELARLQATNEGLNLVIVEKEKRIEDLTREVTTLNGFAHYFKTAEVKQIEAPAAERKKPWYKFW